MRPGAPTKAVLVVEDERIVALDLQQTLGDMGYDAYAIAASSDEVFALVAQRCPDLILMDIRIKGARDGITVAELVREQFNIPVVYLTAHSDSATLARAQATGPYGYLVKPVKTGELRTTIEIALFRHATEQRLRERERWLATTLRSIGDAVVMVDVAGNINYVNPAAERLLQQSAAEVLGRPARDVVRLFDPAGARLESPLDRALSLRESGMLRDAELHVADRDKRVIADSFAPVTDGEDLLGAVMVFRDVTDERRMQRQLELADRLASLGTLAAGLAHEVNNPLAVVVANAELACLELPAVVAELERLGSPLVARARELLTMQREIEISATRIGRIVADLKSFTRPTEPSAGMADVGRALEWAVGSIGGQIRQRARLQLEIADLPPIVGDEMRLGQVFVNLLVNAMQAIEPGAVDTNEIHVRAQASGEHLEVTVRDTGVGMAPAQLARIFEPFFTTKPVGEGTGLGLSICHGIVASFGGTLVATSEPGAGATFVVTLPVARTVAPTAASPAPANRRRSRVLLVDDDPLVHKAITRFLREHELVPAANAFEAIDILAHDTAFDVIVLDMMMPAKTGAELYEQLLSTHPDLVSRIIFVTGGAGTPRTEQFLLAVPNQVIEKPFSGSVLKSAVAEVAERHRRSS